MATCFCQSSGSSSKSTPTPACAQDRTGIARILLSDPACGCPNSGILPPRGERALDSTDSGEFSTFDRCWREIPSFSASSCWVIPNSPRILASDSRASDMFKLYPEHDKMSNNKSRMRQCNDKASDLCRLGPCKCHASVSPFTFDTRSCGPLLAPALEAGSTLRTPAGGQRLDKNLRKMQVVPP